MRTSIRVGYAPPVWKRTHIQGLKETRQTIRGDEGQGLVSSEEFLTNPVI